ncbi:MAG: insulinase family protein [Bacteroidales bacterium]|jgi:predicted Zn-dependent peptidase|nr:insulinase family protein [Bacteroidales bacterium]
MISFEKYTLDNGLTVILHKDINTPIAAVNIAYNVGSRDENPNRTGLAHLFEHLMFGGSKNIPKYDEPLQRAGGENNAFTNVDVTNFYITLPVQNLETAFWLESDRMNELAFSKKSLENQRHVVIEEFKQSYLNQPYGDVMLLLKPLAYKVHPYQWNTIGKKIEHILETTMEEVKEFFYTFYAPNNAVLSVAGNLDMDKTKAMIEKWFGDIPMRKQYQRNLPPEPIQTEARILEVERDVPVDCLYKAYKMGKRIDPDFHSVDLISDIFSNGKSSRLHRNLVKNKQLFSSISAYVLGTFDEGLFIVNGYLAPEITFQQAEDALREELDDLKNNIISEQELEKVKNKIKTVLYYSELQVHDKALNLALTEIMDTVEFINEEENKYIAVTPDDIYLNSKKILQENVCSTLYYKAKSAHKNSVSV